ncbi:ExeA1: general secretion pathway protein A [Desulfosarcina variabilis str. Montpellier]|uniref:ExeA family protein n=1 Tax=Desulfosarcina variabilis TaxID=2300 RepID=UPI003AFA3DAF
MYKRFFGFKERPFKLVPNPAYVYLSRVHEEALAHLNYAVNYGDGFVAITGEVGTGKTTLCRMFLESLDDKTEIAYIFNPKLDALQLLKAINDEFYIPTDTHGADSVKTLIDNFNTFLLKKKAQGRRVILLVDEAQNLSADVLEQLRLLSNLETNSSKLLQIILVGQPELSDLLETDRLRQLKQRITLRCHLIPLDSEETQEYIRHRLYIAATRPGVSFTMAACRSIFRYSGGVPRLINIICDRALLIAFNLGKHRISKDIAKLAIKEVGGKPNRQWLPPKWRMAVFGLVMGGVVLIAVLFAAQILSRRRANSVEPVSHHKIEDTRPSVPQAASANAPQPSLSEKLTLPGIREPLDALPPSVTNAQPDSALSAGPIVVDLQRTIATMQDPFRSRSRALLAVIKAWDAPIPRIPFSKDVRDNEIFFRITARRSDLETLRVKGTLNMIRKLNLPAILEFKLSDTGDFRFLAVVGLVDGKVHLSDNETIFSVAPASLAGLWNGVAYVLWKNFYHFEGVIPVSSPGEVIIALKMHLKTIGFPISEMTAAYDITTRSAVETIQSRHGLNPDGMVGPLTKIVLYNEDRSLDIPLLIPPSVE